MWRKALRWIAGTGSTWRTRMRGCTSLLARCVCRVQGVGAAHLANRDVHALIRVFHIEPVPAIHCRAFGHVRTVLFDLRPPHLSVCCQANMAHIKRFQ